MTNEEANALIREALNTWSSHPNATAEDEKRADAALNVVSSALSSVPDDVARDEKAVSAGITIEVDYPDGRTRSEGLAALSRLATAAARLPGLEADLAQRTRERDSEMEERWKCAEIRRAREARAETAESERDGAVARAAALEAQQRDDHAAIARWRSETEQHRAEALVLKRERDAARQEVETLKQRGVLDAQQIAALDADVHDITEQRDAVRETAGRYCREIAYYIAKAKELTARVAELERERDHYRQEAMDRAADCSTACTQRDEAEARATAAEKRIRDAADRLTGIRSPEREDPLELETCLDDVAALYVRATAAEADRDEWKRRALERAKAYMRENTRAQNAEDAATTPAPGLREAVEKAKTALKEYQRRGSSDHADSLGRLALEALAAYAAPPAVPVEQLRSLASDLLVGPDRAAVEAVLKAEPAVTHADLAAVVEEVSNVLGCAYGAREVQRRVTSGQVPQVLETARVVDVLRDLLDNCCGLKNQPNDCGNCHHVYDAARDLGLTLPTGPGGGETKDSAAESWAQADQQNDAQRRAWASDAIQRARIPEPTPESPPLADAHTEHCTMDACKYGEDACTVAQPEPAAPDVMSVSWENDDKRPWIRVHADGRCEMRRGTDGTWREAAHPGFTQLARALAEAKRENEAAKRILTRAAREMEKDAARKAAESMRERAAETADGGPLRVRGVLMTPRERILALPLEDK